MVRSRRISFWICPALLAVLTAVGCSTIGAPLGLSPPAHKLTDQAEQLRQAGGVAQLPKELQKTLLAPYVVEPGDTLLVVPTKLDSTLRLPGDQPVLQDGTIDLGEYGRPVVAGKTVAQIETEIRQMVAAKSKEDSALNVRLVGRVSKVFYVLGEVNAPGSYPLAGRETVLDGIISAGGITRKASTKKIIVSRPTLPDGCRVVLPICYDNIVQIGDTSTNYQLQPGDRIFVPSQGTFDDLCKSRKKCTICDAAQFPCPTGGNCATPGTAVPGQFPQQ